MSNLYKSQFVIKNDAQKRIINSNDKVSERLQEYINELNKASLEETDNFDDGFVAGINAENVEVLENNDEEAEFVQMQETTQEEQVTSSEIIEQAKLEAEEIINNAKLQAQTQKDEILNLAKEEGYQAGLLEGQQQLNEKQAELENLIQESQSEYQTKLKNMESDLVDVISQVYDSVFHVKFKDEKNVLLYLIEKTILHTDGCKEFRVHLSPNEYRYAVSVKTQYMTDFEPDIRIDFIEDTTLEQDQCVIETDCGIFDCGVGEQLRNLTRELKMLCV